mmetsp:Transcript_41060/g.113097  ORF Transcript_41060/g.113097 Transcript_41060/m.113097 type:complete len:639 (-) Transcript_41060:65-1981(-)
MASPSHGSRCVVQSHPSAAAVAAAADFPPSPWRLADICRVLWSELLRGDAHARKLLLQMLFVKVVVILPLRSVAPFACTYWTWWLLQILRRGAVAPRSTPDVGRRPMLRLFVVGLQEIGRLWLGVEAFFVMFYLFKSRQLEAKAAKPPRIPHGHVIPTLRRVFQATEDIQYGGKFVAPAGSSAWSPAILSRQSSAPDLKAAILPSASESNVEELLREWHSKLESLPLEQGQSSPSLSKQQRQTIERMVDDAEMNALKRAEFSGWFLQREGGACERWPTARLGEIRVGNIEEFVAWGFYNCRPDELPEDRLEEFRQAIEEGSQWVGMRFQPGYNPDALPMRVTMDRIRSQHRPFAYYCITALTLPFVTGTLLTRLGFKQYNSGTLFYWHRPPGPSPVDATRQRQAPAPPIVFVHGIGINLLPYYFMIVELLKLAADRVIFLVSLPHVSMRLQEHVPSSAEMVACLSDMLASWGHPKGHFVGHSFGTLPIAWMVRRAPDLVSMATFIDPVCFLIIKPDVCYNFLYKRPSTPAELVSNFFVARELFIANSLSRNFFWFNNLLWPEDVTMPSLVALSGEDNIVPAHSIRRYLTAYKARHNLDRMELLWFPNNCHGECFVPGRLDSCQRVLQHMLVMEGMHGV